MADSKNDRSDGSGRLREVDPADWRGSTPKPATDAQSKAGGSREKDRATAEAPPPPAKLATRQQGAATSMINGRPEAPSPVKRVALKVVGTGSEDQGASPPRRAKQPNPPTGDRIESTRAARDQPTLKATINRTSMNPDAHSRPGASGKSDRAAHGGPAKPNESDKIEARDAPAAAAVSGKPPKKGRSRPTKAPADKMAAVDAGSDSPGTGRGDAAMPGSVMPGRPIVSRKVRPSVAPPERPAPKDPGEPGTLPPQLLRPGKEKSTIVNPFTKKRRGFGRPTGRPLLVTALVALIGVMVWQSGLFDERVDALFDGPTPPKRAATEPGPLETAAPGESAAKIGEAADSTDTTPRTASSAILQTSKATDPDRPSLQGQELEEVIELLGTLDLLPEGAVSGDDAELTEAILLFQEMAGLEASGRADHALLEELRTVTGMMRDTP